MAVGEHEVHPPRLVAVELIDLAAGRPRPKVAAGVPQNHAGRTLDPRIADAVVIHGKRAVPVTDPTHVATPRA